MYETLLTRIEDLGRVPFPDGNQKLVNREGWRNHLGDYRILYTIDSKKKELTILSAAHRREAYR